MLGEAHDAIGAVKWYNLRKVTAGRGIAGLFVYLSAVERRPGIGDLHERQKVSFELERRDREPTSAVNLKQARRVMGSKRSLTATPSLPRGDDDDAGPDTTFLG